MGFLRIDHHSGLKSAHIKSVIKLAAMVQHTLLCVWSQMGFTWIYCNFYIVEHTFRAPMICIWLLSGYITNAYVRKYKELDTLIINDLFKPLIADSASATAFYYHFLTVAIRRQTSLFFSSTFYVIAFHGRYLSK